MFVLVQHGETRGEAEKRLMGQRHDPLTPLGKQRAEEFREALSGVQFTKGYTARKLAPSDTAFLILDRIDPISIDTVDELFEPSGGDYESQLYADLKKQLPPKQYRLWDRDWFAAPPMGESMADCAERVLTWCDRNVFAQPEQERILLVVGPRVMQIILGRVQQMETSELLQLKPLPLPYFVDRVI